MLAREIVYPLVPRLMAPALGLVRLHTIGLLSDSIRAAYGFSWSPRHQAWMTVSTRVVRAALRLTPPIARHWPAARRAARRHRSRVR